MVDADTPVGLYHRIRKDLKQFVDAKPDTFGGIVALRAKENLEPNKLTLRLVVTYAFNGEDRGRVGDARDLISEYILEWLAREGVGVTIPAVRDGDLGNVAAVRHSVL